MLSYNCYCAATVNNFDFILNHITFYFIGRPIDFFKSQQTSGVNFLIPASVEMLVNSKKPLARPNSIVGYMSSLTLGNK